MLHLQASTNLVVAAATMQLLYCGEAMQVAVFRGVIHTGTQRHPIKCAQGSTSLRTCTTAKCSKTDQGASNQRIIWFVEQTEKPAFLLVQGVLGSGFLALLDGGLSGVYHTS